jgi:cytoskeleton protein RodZ
VYAKGHLKKYASILGLPAAEILTAFGSDAPPAAAKTVLPSSVRLSTSAPAAANLPWPQLAAAAMIALLIGGVLWWRPWHQRSTVPPARGASSAQPSAASVAEMAPARAPEGPSAETGSSHTATTGGADAADAPAPAAPGALAAAGSADAPAAMPAVPSKSAGSGVAANETDAARGTGRARLRLSFSADSWVDVHDAEGRRVFAGSGRANSVKTIAGLAPLRVYLGFASGVQLQLNDRAVAIGPQFVTGDVARFEAGADGVLRRDTHAAPPNGVQTRAAPPRG